MISSVCELPGVSELEALSPLASLDLYPLERGLQRSLGAYPEGTALPLPPMMTSRSQTPASRRHLFRELLPSSPRWGYLLHVYPVLAWQIFPDEGFEVPKCAHASY